VGDEVEAIVTEVDLDSRRISLSLRQAQRNPWEELARDHPEGSVVEGRVRNLTDFGAFVEIADGIDGLIHISDLSRTRQVRHPSEVLKKGDRVRVRITHIDGENQRVSLSLQELLSGERQSERPRALPRLRTTPIHLEAFARDATSGLGDRAWMVEEFVTQPFLLEVDFPQFASEDAFFEYYDKLEEIRFDIRPFLTERADPDRLVFLALYPSGAVRGLTATVRREEATWVRLHDASALFDPDTGRELPPRHCEVRLVALETPVP